MELLLRARPIPRTRTWHVLNSVYSAGLVRLGRRQEFEIDLSEFLRRRQKRQAAHRDNLTKPLSHNAYCVSTSDR